jgi:ParB family transcriptional regulator, chromosome partitioning protein
VAERQRGMGRGLAAILSVAPREEAEELRQLPLDLISANPHQPRDNFDEAALVALAESIKVRGVLQPVLVRPLPGGTYELIAGERRWRAAKLAELEAVPAIVRHHDDATSLEVALIENMAREDLNPVEEARACAALTEELGLSREEVGRRVGRSRVAVSNLIRLLDLPDETLESIQTGDLSEGHGRALLLAPDHGDRRRLGRSAVQQSWSVRETESRARGTRAEADDSSAVRAHRRRARGLHPDQEAAIAEIGDTFEAALGREVKVSASGEGFRAQLEFASAEEALELARSLKLSAPGSTP